jgi:hypothetical protein
MAITLIRKILVLVAAMLVGLVAAVVTAQAPAQAQEQDRWVYTGTATTRVQVVNIFGQPTGVETYQTPVEVVRLLPGPRDPNPFFLSIQSKPLVNDPGEVSIVTAERSGEVLYWRLQSQDNVQQQQVVTEFTGTLTDTHAREARAANLITIPEEIGPNNWQPSILAMGTGTRMSGAGNSARIQLQVEGNTTDQAHPFTVTIDVTRSG